MPRLDRDGVRIFYEEAGAGNPPMVFLHGWSCDHTYFAPQFDYYRGEHRVVSLDLRGHGHSDKPQQRYSIGEFAEDVYWLCRELGVGRPIVLGHSMGGNISLELAARHPDEVSALVLVDSPVIPPPAILESLANFAAALNSESFRDSARNFASRLFLPIDDPEVKKRVLGGGISSLPQHVLASSMEGLVEHDTIAAASSCKAPVLYIGAQVTLADLDEFRSLCPQLMVGRAVGVGHFVQLIVPKQVNAMIDRFLAVAL